jgi:hypothetical protein
VLHALAAKASKDHGFSTQQQELQLAAVYASDRAVLKEVMSALEADADPIPTAPATEDETIKTAHNKVEIEAPIDIISTLNKVDLSESIIKDLEQLNKSRHDFELMFAEGASKATEVKPSENLDSNTQENEAEAEKNKTAKSKKERIIELARAKATESSASPETEEKSPTKKRGNIDVLIDEIASTKKEIDPETEQQKAQIHIIDQFIKAQPILAYSKEKPLVVPTVDLSTIKSGEFGDNIVSETLVDILIKQGKKDKAIEVLKKLIWKFPQKKAYFAAQIEELKK